MMTHATLFIGNTPIMMEHMTPCYLHKEILVLQEEIEDKWHC